MSRWLKDDDYLRCHRAFRKHSDEWEVLQAHVRALGFFQNLSAPAPQILSVGCGSGEMDLPWLAELAQRGAPGRYTAVEPNAASVEKFTAAAVPFLHPGSVQLDVRGQKYEDFRPPAPLDRIMFMHSLYHFPDRLGMLHKALQELAPGGRILVCVSDDDGLPRYKTAVYQQIEMPAQSQYFPGNDLRRIVDELGCPCTFTQATVSIDVTECPQLTSDGISLLDFCFLCRFEALSEAQQQTALAELPRHLVSAGGRHILKQTTLFAELQGAPKGPGLSA